jgi:hypothetical protein
MSVKFNRSNTVQGNFVIAGALTLQMNRLLLIAALFAIFAVTLVPAFDAVVSHHDDTAVPHAAQDDDCGCVCHVEVHAVIVALTMDLHLSIAFVEHANTRSLPDPLPTSLDRPPELFS